MIEVKLRKVVQFWDDVSPTFITIMKAAEIGINGESLYHLVVEEPDSCEFKLWSKAQIKEYFGHLEEHKKMVKLLEEIENERL